MAGEAAIGLSVYAAVEADAARDAAERAEMQAFVNGYSHHSATPAERKRYVESVRVLYPEPKSPERKADEAVALRLLGLFIVACFVIPSACAAIGWWRGDAEEGLHVGFAVIFGTIVFGFLAAIFAIGVGLLCGGIGP